MAPYLQWAEDYRADGIMIHSLLSCRPGTFTLLHAPQYIGGEIECARRRIGRRHRGLAGV